MTGTANVKNLRTADKKGALKRAANAKSRPRERRGAVFS